jgi:hypothetical protein
MTWKGEVPQKESYAQHAWNEFDVKLEYTYRYFHVCEGNLRGQRQWEICLFYISTLLQLLQMQTRYFVSFALKLFY